MILLLSSSFFTRLSRVSYLCALRRRTCVSIFTRDTNANKHHACAGKTRTKTRKIRLGLTRFTSFDNQTGSSDGTDKCASSSASYFRAFSSSTLLLPSWHPDPLSASWERSRAARTARRRDVKKLSNEDRATTGRNVNSTEALRGVSFWFI